MSSPQPFGDLLEANKLMEGAVAGLMRNVNSRIDDLEKKQDDDAATFRTALTTEQTALWDAINGIKKDLAASTDRTTTLLNSVSDLSRRLTTIQSGLTQVERLVTDLGKQYGEKDVEMNRDTQKIMERMEAIAREQNNLQAKVACQEKYQDSISMLSARLLRSEHSSAFPRITSASNKSSPPLKPSSNRNIRHDEHLAVRPPDSFRFPSPDLGESFQIFQPPGPHVPTAINRTASARPSGIYERELHHKRSGSLQRKRGSSDLRKASRESLRDSLSGGNLTPGETVMRTPSRLQNAFAPTQTDSDEEEFGRDGDSGDEAST